MGSQFKVKVERQLNAIWYGGSGSYLIKSLIYLALPLVWLGRLGHFLWLNYIRPKYKFDSLIQKIKNRPVFIIVVGNITVGGTGKTPIVAKLCEQLCGLGYKPAVLSKGYLGRLVSTVEPHFIQAGEDSPQDWGDEPVLLANHFRENKKIDCMVPVVVCKNRVTAIKSLLDTYSEVNIILTDDGLQDKNLRDLRQNLGERHLIKIAVIDAKRGLGNQKLLPAGPLRQAKSSLKNMDWIISHCVADLKLSVEPSPLTIQTIIKDKKITKNIENKTIHITSAIVSFEQINPKFPKAYYTPSDFVVAHNVVQAITGIGHPERFFQNLQNLGLKIRPMAYPDHHDFKPEDLFFNNKTNNNEHLPIIITQKDAIKIQAFAHKIAVPIWVANLDIEGIEPLVKYISGCCTTWPYVPRHVG